ncbi:hypothetical protein M0R45_017659 [Rubus argutus]|uniref:Uncharacterized protein n=1 Tax=Rubus argutus TaxID=59490 RepID=A0AAW1XWD3_RUBAR
MPSSTTTIVAGSLLSSHCYHGLPELAHLTRSKLKKFPLKLDRSCLPLTSAYYHHRTMTSAMGRSQDKSIKASNSEVQLNSRQHGTLLCL